MNMVQINSVGVDLSSREGVLYFAYAGDLDSGQISARCGAAPEFVAVARLRDYALSFYGHDERWDGGEETIVRAPGAEVWGVVWRLGARAFDRLDAWRNVRLDGEGAYFHSPVDVVAFDGSPLSAMTYRKANLGEVSPPSGPSLARIVAAGRGHGLPEAYLAALEAKPTVAADGPVPREGRLDRFLASTEFGGSCAC